MATDTDAILPATPHTAAAEPASARVPLYAAGPGEPDTALDVLRAAGWASYEDELANKTLVSPDGQVTCEFGPETDRYAHNRRTALWQVTFAHLDPQRASGWSALFGDEVPAQAIAAFLTALTDPAGQSADRDPARQPPSLGPAQGRAAPPDKSACLEPDLMTDAPAATSLAERARAAAANRTAATDPAWGNTRWVARAQQVAARLAMILAIRADQITVQASTVRRYGGWPWPELTVTDAEQRFRFIVAYSDPDQITALELCPFCEGEVPTFPIRSLADLGDLIAGEVTDNDVELSCAFDQDPGHKPGCTHAARIA